MIFDKNLLQKTRFLKIITLFLLYLSQGMPFGFQVKALPVYLRTQGISLTAIGITGILAAPWLFKALWAPVIDRYFFSKIGRRKSWIIPTQILLFLSIIFASTLDPKSNLKLLYLSIFFMNFFAATQDIAVDGLAVDILKKNELGPGNSAQVIGYKIGMLISGGLLVWLSDFTGWNSLFLIMATITLLPLITIIFFNENEASEYVLLNNNNFKKILSQVKAVFNLPGAVWLIFFILSYKMGEVMIDIMFKPFLIDNGFTASQIGLWLGTYGMGASIIGSIFGGILAFRLSIIKSITIALILRLIPLIFQWFIALIGPTDISVITVTIAEHFFGGMLTTVMFAFMMSRVDKTIGATHYTILASLEVLGKSPGGWISGFVAETYGYHILFGIGVILSLIVLFFIPKLSKINYKPW